MEPYLADIPWLCKAQAWYWQQQPRRLAVGPPLGLSVPLSAMHILPGLWTHQLAAGAHSTSRIINLGRCALTHVNTTGGWGRRAGRVRDYGPCAPRNGGTETARVFITFSGRPFCSSR